MCAIASSPSPSSSASLRSAGVSPGLCTEAGETAGIPLAGVCGEGALDEDDGADDAGEAATAGVVDDAAYAATLARTRFAEKGAARKAIAEELRRKGLGEEHIRSALGQIGFDDEADAALALARKKLAATRGLDPLVRRRRALAMLGRKGYSHEVAMRAIEQALAGPD